MKRIGRKRESSVLSENNQGCGDQTKCGKIDPVQVLCLLTDQKYESVGAQYTETERTYESAGVGINCWMQLLERKSRVYNSVNLILKVRPS